jgi:hypothetical protein
MKLRTNGVPSPNTYCDTTGPALEVPSRYGHAADESTGSAAVCGTLMLVDQPTRAEGDRLLQHTPNL